MKATWIVLLLTIHAALAFSLPATWDFWPETFLVPGQPATKPPVLLNVPGAWDAVMPNHSGVGFGTYRVSFQLPAGIAPHEHWGLRVMKAGTSYRVFANGVFLAEVGHVGTSPEMTQPRYKTALIPLPPEMIGPLKKLDLQFDVANFSDRNGGLWNPIEIGPWKNLVHKTQVAWSLELLLSGAFSLLALYQLLLFFFRRNAQEYLFVALICLAMAVYTLVYAYCTLEWLFPHLSWDVYYKLEYGAIIVGMSSGVGYLVKMYPQDIPSLVLPVCLSLMLGYVGFLFLAPTILISRAVWLVYVFLLGFLGILLFGMIRALYHKRLDALAVLAALALVGASILTDLLLVNFNIPHLGVSPWGTLIALTVVAYLISVRFWRNDQSVQRLTENLKQQNQALIEMNEAFIRFVPQQFLELLTKKETDLRLGDHIDRPMTIMFLRIQNLNELKQSLNYQELFQYLNTFHQKAGPIIRQHQGFVDKYMAHGLMALFDGSVDQAFQAALTLQALIASENSKKNPLEPKLEIGIGLHFGPLVLGIIGEKDRLESTVIADAVNLSSRIESLTSQYKAPILTSEETLKASLKEISWREKGRVKVKGKSQTVSLIEIF